MPTPRTSVPSIANMSMMKSSRWFFLQPPLLPGFSLSFGYSVLYISLVILFPISALFLYVSDMTWAEYWQAVTDRRVMRSYWVTLEGALIATVCALLIGGLFAWIITRYEFPGRRFLDSLMDLPFALPTAVAGLTLAALLVPNGWLGQWLAPFGIKVSYAFPGIVIAMIFTSLPFVVRTLQPVLQDLGPELEEAARTLGATPFQTFRFVIFPTLIPALITAASQSLIRSLGEFGAVVMIAGNIPMKTEVTSLMIFVRLQEFNHSAAAAIATVILLISLLLLFGLQFVQSRALKWQRKN